MNNAGTQSKHNNYNPSSVRTIPGPKSIVNRRVDGSWSFRSPIPTLESYVPFTMVYAGGASVFLSCR